MTEPYWTTFCIDGLDPGTDLHITHKFFGELAPSTVDEIEYGIGHFFGRTPLGPIQIVFDRPALFGENNDVKVLTSPEAVRLLSQYDPLRQHLDQFAADTHPNYIPHITTEFSGVVALVTGYALMHGKEMVRHWAATPSFRNARDVTELPAIKETVDDYDELEKRIAKAFRDQVYYPILRTLGVGRSVIANAKAATPLIAAIESGGIRFDSGQFTGRFSAAVSKEIKSIGGTWDRKASAWQIPYAALPAEVRQAIAGSEAKFLKVLDRIDDKIRQILPAEIAGKVDSQPLFDSSLWKVDRKIDNTLTSISVLPVLTPERRAKIAAEWRDNLDLWIKDFAADQIPKLRDQIAEHALRGGRVEDIVATLQQSYGITLNKARFLARQETALLMTKFKEQRYLEAGVNEYKWTCVAGSPAHPVRPSHKILDGKIFRWDDPPVTTAPGQAERRNNPGQDFNCRCSARPIVRGSKGNAV